MYAFLAVSGLALQKAVAMTIDTPAMARAIGILRDVVDLLTTIIICSGWRLGWPASA